MGELCFAFQTEATTEMFNVYWKHLQDCDFAKFEANINTLIKTADKFPSIHQILNCEGYTPTMSKETAAALRRVMAAEE